MMTLFLFQKVFFQVIGFPSHTTLLIGPLPHLFLARSIAAADGTLHIWLIFSPGLGQGVFLEPVLCIRRSWLCHVVLMPPSFSL